MPRSHTHRSLCRLVATWLLKQKWCAVVSWELAYNEGFVDVLGISSYRGRDKRVTAIEVKRTKSDLTQDIRSGKYLKYEMHSTHCYLAATKEALGMRHSRDTKTAFTLLKELGLPNTWGILLLPTIGSKQPLILRRAKRQGKVLPGLLEDLTLQIAKSFAKRTLNARSPIGKHK